MSVDISEIELGRELLDAAELVAVVVVVATTVWVGK